MRVFGRIPAGLVDRMKRTERERRSLGRTMGIKFYGLGYLRGERADVCVCVCVFFFFC